MQVFEHKHLCEKEKNQSQSSRKKRLELVIACLTIQ